MQLLSVILCAIQLVGVTGSELRARAFFDANNVKVGDPLVLTIDFLGNAEFRDLHPPALAKAVDGRVWRVDDASAKTDTFRDARRLTYRVRPLKEGVVWFPGLSFEYVGADGSKRLVRSNDIPVHAKGGAQVVVAGMDEAAGAGEKMPSPPDLVVTPPDGLSADEDFAWRKACAHPTADAFAAFSFPEAALNEARCAVLEGNWARALKVYSRVEWRIGQTPDVERGIVSALALRHDNPEAELPVWRQVLRPVLRYDWRGRAAIVFGGLALLAVVGWLLGRIIRALACIAVALLFVVPASGQDIFQQMHQQMQRMHQQMQQSFGGFSFHFGEKEEREPVRIEASVAIDRKSLQVGEGFAFIVSIEAPRTASIGQIRMVPSEAFGLTVTGSTENLPDAVGTNPSNVVKRISVPVRYDVPFRGKLSFAIEGMVSERRVRDGGRFNMSFSNSFRCDSAPILVDVRPLPKAGQPADFSGIISEGLALFELPDILRVETNDVVTITYRMRPKGYVPADFLPRDVAFEWTRQTDGNHRLTEIEYRRYFVASGAPKTPELSISYYDPRTKEYKRATAGGTSLVYVPERE